MEEVKRRNQDSILERLKSRHLAQFTKHLVNNITGTLIDTFFLWLLSTFYFETHIGKYVIAPAISFEIAMLKNFFTSYFWIWHERVEKRPGEFLKKLFLYNLNCFFTFLGKLGIILLIDAFTDLNVVYCNLIALLLTGTANYLIQDKMIFRRSPQHTEIS